MADISDSTAGKRRRKLLLIRIVALGSVFLLVVWWYAELGRSVPPKGEMAASIDTANPHLEATFPRVPKLAGAASNTTTFYIPKAYVDYAGIVAWSGGTRSVPIVVELPDKTPSSLAPPRPWKNLPRGSPEAEALKREFSKTHFGSFRVMLNLGGFDPEEFLRNSVLNPKSTRPFVQIGPIGSLLRYAKLDCLQPFRPNENEEYKRLRQEEITKKRAQAEPSDPPIPPHCAIDRRIVTMFTPLGTPAERALYVDSCDLRSCDSYIRIAGVNARLHIPHELLPQWNEVVQPTRELVESFLAPASSGSNK
jgi:hypothetical protein